MQGVSFWILFFHHFIHEIRYTPTPVIVFAGLFLSITHTGLRAHLIIFALFFLYFHYHWRQGACGIDDFFSFYLFCGPVRCKRRSFCFFTLPFIGTHTQTLWPAGHNFLVIYFYNVGHALRDTEQSFFFITSFWFNTFFFTILTFFFCFVGENYFPRRPSAAIASN